MGRFSGVVWHDLSARKAWGTRDTYEGLNKIAKVTTIARREELIGIKVMIRVSLVAMIGGCFSA